MLAPSSPPAADQAKHRSRPPTTKTDLPPTTQTAYAINGAFLAEIKESCVEVPATRRDLLEIWNKLGVASEQSHRGVQSLVAKLGHYRDALAMMFSLEQTYGYVKLSSPPPSPPANPRGPSNTPPADLLGEHETLYTDLQHLIDRVDEDVFRGRFPDNFALHRSAVQRFLHRVDQHDHQETLSVRSPS